MLCVYEKKYLLKFLIKDTPQTDLITYRQESLNDTTAPDKEISEVRPPHLLSYGSFIEYYTFVLKRLVSEMMLPFFLHHSKYPVPLNNFVSPVALKKVIFQS